MDVQNLTWDSLESILGFVLFVSEHLQKYVGNYHPSQEIGTMPPRRSEIQSMKYKTTRNKLRKEQTH